jgi:DNA-binding Lrp family transcriptional regulator
MRPLDRIDRIIVAAMQKNARVSNKELAATVGLAPSSCHARVRRLEDEGVLRGYHADVDPRALGVGLEAMVHVQLSTHGPERIDRFREAMIALPEVRAVFYLAGRHDFLVHIVVRDSEHLRDVVMHAFTRVPEVRHLETALIFDHTRNADLPDFLDGVPEPPATTKRGRAGAG